MNSFSSDFSHIVSGSMKILAVIIIIVLIAALLWYVQKNDKEAPRAQPQKKKGDAEKKKEEEKSLGSSWKSIPEWLQKMILVFVLLFAVYLLFFMAPDRQPVYKQVIEKETVLNEGDVIEFKIAKGDSVHLRTKNLPHLVVWQGFNEQHGESKHYSGKEWIEISNSSRVVRIYPCKKHEIYGGTLFYTIYRK